MKRLLILLCMCVFLTVSAFAVPTAVDVTDSEIQSPAILSDEKEIVESGTCGENLTWTLDSEGTLTISGDGEMTNWEKNNPWGDYSSSIVSVVIRDGVTSIGDYAFFDCINLTNLTIPESVLEIGEIAFWGCDSLTNVTIPEGVTTIGRKAFFLCNSLTNVTIPESVTTIGTSAFGSCSNLAIINVNSNNRYYSSDEQGVLYNKEKNILLQYPAAIVAESFTIPESVTILGENAFYHCLNLVTITIPNGVTTVGAEAFSFCERLTSITIPESVATIGMGHFLVVENFLP